MAGLQTQHGQPMNRPQSCTGHMPDPRPTGDHSWASPHEKPEGLPEGSSESGKGGKSKYGKSKGKITNTFAYLSELNESQLMDLFPPFRAKEAKRVLGLGRGRAGRGTPAVQRPDGCVATSAAWGGT